ncbi:MAG: dihydropteroate synthase [Candidatus Pelagibacter sp.]
MEKYYTRACNFYYGSNSKKKITQKNSLPLNGNNLISFDSIELITRKSKRIISIKKINKLPIKIKKKVLLDLKNITKIKKFSKLKFGNIPILMGILNITPDSFSDGGKFLNNKLADRQILKLLSQGAKIIDLGGESTRPGAKEVDPKEEWKRIRSKLKNLSKRKCIISLDTRKSFIIKKSLPYKVSLVNDVSGLSYDKDTIEILKKSKIPFVIHHMKGIPKTMQINPSYQNVLLDIYDFFEKKLKLIRAKNIKHNNIILDPGIGFGKNLKHNITLINQISIFHSLGFPIMLGLSKKKFIKDLSGNNDSKERIGGTVSSCIYSSLQGIQILRVHDVNEVNQALKVFKKLQLS